jgi:uncharacterized protein YkwD
MYSTDSFGPLALMRPWPGLLLAAWLALPSAAVGQMSEGEDIEVMRSSAKATRQDDGPDLAQVAERIIQKTNQFRQSEELQTVRTNPELMETARYFADYMAKTNRYGHTADGQRPSQRAKDHDYQYCLISENIAYQYSSAGFQTEELAESFFEGWKHSPGHRENMLEPAVTETGVAVAQSPDTGYFFAVQMFGRPKSQSIQFTVANESGSEIQYEIGTRIFPLPPRYSRTHERCRPEELVFRWPNEDKRPAKTVQASDGDRFIVTQQAEVKVTRE